MPNYELAEIEGHYALRGNADVYDSHASLPNTVRTVDQSPDLAGEPLSTNAGRHVVAMSLPGFVKKGYEPPALPLDE